MTADREQHPNGRLWETMRVVGMTQRGLADALGCSLVTVQRWIRDGRTPQPARAEEVAARLGVAASWLWPGRGQAPVQIAVTVGVVDVSVVEVDGSPALRIGTDTVVLTVRAEPGMGVVAAKAIAAGADAFHDAVSAGAGLAADRRDVHTAAGLAVGVAAVDDQSHGAGGGADGDVVQQRQLGV